MKEEKKDFSHPLSESTLPALLAVLEKHFFEDSIPDSLLSKEERGKRSLAHAEKTLKQVELRYRRGASLLLEKLQARLKNQ